VYGLSKLVAEMLIAQWHAMLARRCRVVVGRLFNVYGPGDTNPHVLPEIVQQLRRGNVLRLGNVAPRRDYVWVDDVALAIASLVGTSAARRDHSITTVNVGTGVSTCVEEIVERLASVTGRALSIDTDPERVRESDRPNLQADTSRFRALYGHALPTALEDGLRILVEAEGFA
jgi:UDP-glucose 4-epimerase